MGTQCRDIPSMLLWFVGEMLITTKRMTCFRTGLVLLYKQSIKKSEQTEKVHVLPWQLFHCFTMVPTV